MSFAAPGAAVAAKAPITVTFWEGMSGELGQTLNGLIRKFNATHPGIRVVATYEGSYSGGGAEQQKLLAAITAHTVPDIAQMEANSLSVFAASGALVPLTGLVKSVPGVAPADFLSGMLESTTYRGVQYAVPFNRSMPVIIYNATMFAKAGITHAPTTWAQLAQDAKRLTHGSGPNKVYGFAPLVDWWPWEAAVYSGGGSVVSSNLKSATFDSPAALRILDIELGLIKHGYADVQTGPNYGTLTIEQFMHGQSAMEVDSSGDLGQIVQGVKFQVGAMLLPRLTTRQVPPGGGNFVLMKGMSPSAERAAMTFISWMCAPVQTVAWSEQTGYMPVTKAGVKSAAYQAYLKKYPQFQAALNELPYQRGSAQTPAYVGILQIAQETLQAIFDEGENPVAAMKAAVLQANTLLRNAQG